jgi:hypothetical protein
MDLQGGFECFPGEGVLHDGPEPKPVNPICRNVLCFLSPSCNSRSHDALGYRHWVTARDLWNIDCKTVRWMGRG